jgi:heme/copper-type cytochrome/quinol oxidase subunit 2
MSDLYVPLEQYEMLRSNMMSFVYLMIAFLLFAFVLVIFFAYKYEHAKKELQVYQISEKLKKELKEEKA